MRQHSDVAWKIASLYSHVLASETRDLAAHIDLALGAERERCARIAESAINVANGQRKAGMARAIMRRIREADGQTEDV